MGWWGYGIMEGDTPCDCRYDILRAAADKDAVEALVGTGADEYDAMESVGLQELQYPSVSLKMLQAIKQTTLCVYDTSIAVQVLAHMLMTEGYAMLPEIKHDAIMVSKQMIADIDTEGWCDKEARITALKSFIQCLNTYDGTPMTDTNKGLLETILGGE